MYKDHDRGKEVGRMLDYKVITFLKVCETLNFTKAAEDLHITQPAVSRHIHCLEDECKVKLFKYRKKKITLTPAGEILRHYATAMENDESILMATLAQTGDQRKVLRFGTTKTVGDFAIAKPLGAYMNAHTDTDIHMVVANTEELLCDLRSGSIHFALVEGYFNSNEFDSEKFSTEEFIPVCASGHTFVKEPDDVKDLLNEVLLIREPGSGTRDILEKNLITKNVSIDNFARTVEIASMHVILQLISDDFGISFMYRAAAAKELESRDIRELKLKDFQVNHDFAFIWNKGSVFTDMYRSICQELCSYR